MTAEGVKGGVVKKRREGHSCSKADEGWCSHGAAFI